MPSSSGTGARHLHLHLIPRHSGDGASETWAAADLYRTVVQGQRSAANPAVVAALLRRARSLWIGAGEGSTLAP